MSGDPLPKEHRYDAQAFALEADLQLPLRAVIPPQAFVDLPKKGGYLSERARDYRLEGVISYRSAYTQVAGNRDPKPGHGYVTLATAVLEDFNILDVVTADRVVAQVSTEHPLDGDVPTVTFLGTRFDNLRIAGHPVRIDLDANFLGEKPGSDAPWSTSSGFRDRVAAQRDHIRHQTNLPAEIAERYNRLPSNPGPQESIECSLVQHAEGSYPGRTFGHVIDIPHFGRVYLATVRLVETRDPDTKAVITLFRLTMIEAQMGCIGNGTASGGTTITNGGKKGSG
ncbi:MAG: choice-of-anchor P family protein [Acidobacteriaceae bacterium]